MYIYSLTYTLICTHTHTHTHTHAQGGAGIKVSPKKGSAVLFYNLLEDGNGDDLALHAALPVHVI